MQPPRTCDFLGFAGRMCEVNYRLAGDSRERKFFDSDERDSKQLSLRERFQADRVEDT